MTGVLQVDNNKGFYQNLWEGNYSLGRTYWLYGVIGNVLAYMFAWVVMIFLPSPVEPFALILPLIYGFMVLIGVWNAASKYNGFFLWAWLARIIVACNVVTAVYKFAVLSSLIAAFEFLP